MTDRNIKKISFSYLCFKKYIGFVNALYFPHRYAINFDNIPSNDVPVIMAGNHQNCLNDPLSLEVMIRGRKPYCLVRSDVFKNKFFTAFLNWLGLLPVSRMNFEGEKFLENTNKTFEVAKHALSEGNTLILFPEAGHQDKHWLGYFSLGYMKLAFEAAEVMDFKKEVYIMPFCNHYEEYFHPGYDMLIQCGTPIPLSEFYELYKTKPRTAQREANKLVRKQISDLMLNIEDVENYQAIDYLRNSAFGIAFAKRHNFDPDFLPGKMASDKLLVNEIAALKIKEKEETEEILQKAKNIDNEIKELHIRDWIVEKKPGFMNLILRCLLLIITLPLFIVSLIPTFLVFLVPKYFHGLKINGAIDVMFKSSFNIGTAALVTFPICWFLAAIIILCCCGWLYGLGYFILFPLMVLFVCLYQRWHVKFMGVCRFCRFTNKKRIANVMEKRKMLFELLNKKLQNI